MRGLLLRRWAEARLQPGDLTHYPNWQRAIYPGEGFRSEWDDETKAQLGRLFALKAELGRLCYAGGLSGYYDGRKLVDPIEIPPGEWHNVQPVWLLSKLRYRRDEYVAAHVDDDVEAVTTRRPGRPSRGTEIIDAYAALATRQEITGNMSWPAIAELIRRRLNASGDAPGLDNETIRRIVTDHLKTINSK
jgi:hypothetical protein